MSKLILSVDDKIIDEYLIGKDIITIGRHASNYISLDSLDISAYHTQIKTVLKDSFVEDLNSTNGTFVNSKIIKKHALKDGDIIDIGNHRIKYISHLETDPADSDVGNTGVMTSDSGPNIDTTIAKLVEQIDAIADTEMASTDSDKQTTSSPSKAKNQAANKKPLRKPSATANNAGRIQILNGENTGKELALDKSLTTIEKPGVAVVGITKRRDSYFIIHVEGSGDKISKLNGKIIEGKAQPLKAHDIIDVAGIKFEFFVE